MRNTYITTAVIAVILAVAPEMCRAQVIKNSDLEKYSKEKYGEKWVIADHFPFVEKDRQKRTCAKALVMTHAYSNVVMDKIEEAVTKGIVGNEDDNW